MVGLPEQLDLEQRRATLRRFLEVGIVGWTAFLVADFYVSHAYHAPLEYLVALRFAGTSIGTLAYVIVRSRDVPEMTLAMVEWVVFIAAGVLVSLSAIASGGIASPVAPGVGLVIIVRALLPAPLSRALAMSLLTAWTFPIVMMLASLASPTLTKQLHSASASTFTLSSILLVMIAVVTSVGARMKWDAKPEQETRRLGAYRLVSQIGTGGMGEVWLARQLPLDRPVALKLLHKRVVEEPGAIRRFQREAQSASALSCPNTIKIYDFGSSENGIFFIAMELLQGMDLEAMVTKGGALSASRTIHLGRQICASLAEAHRNGIVHCDVKPANIFVAKVGDTYDFVKVLDFGLARVNSNHAATTVIDDVRGTPAFMPPEVVRGEDVGPESDVYALGALLYYMLTAKVVFPVDSYDAMIAAQVSGIPELPSKRIGRRLPEDLEAIVMKCLSKNRVERYPSARELEEALATCADASRWTDDDARLIWEELRPSLITAAVARSG